MAAKIKKVFISHSSNDSVIVQRIVELFEDLGLTEEQVVCSSVPGYGIPLGEDIYDWLAQQFRAFELHVLFMLSNNYYKSIACQNEMGATWVLKTKYDTFLLPGFEFKDIKGAVNPNQIGIKLDGDVEMLKQRLNELKDNLVDEFELAAPSASKWERLRQSFISDITSFSTEATLQDDSLNDIAPVFKNHIQLTEDAQLLLIAGANDPRGQILALPMMGGFTLSTNNQTFCAVGSTPRVEAQWNGALEELENYGFVQATSYKRQVFTVTRDGYEYADSISESITDAIAPIRPDIL